MFSTSYIFSQPDIKMLEKAYKEKSATKLKDFFVGWSQDVPPITDTELLELNDTIQQTYKAFISFYKPHRLDSIGGSEWGNDIYKKADFVIVQNAIEIYFTDKVYYSAQETEKYIFNFFGPDSRENAGDRILTDSITDFRPAVRCDKKTPLFLTEKYDKIINSFLGNNYLPLGTGGIMNPARSKGQSAKRKKFLENYVKIFHGHWGGYWQLYSYPEVYSITFDNDMKYARIDFRLVYEGGEALLKNEEGVWTLISSELTWIE